MNTDGMRDLIDIVNKTMPNGDDGQADLDERDETIDSATGSDGMINRRKAKAAVDPHDYFKGEKSAYQDTK
jgi:hypothetical protein